MYEIYQEMLALAERMGEVVEAHLYSEGFITLTIRTPDGKTSTLSHTCAGSAE